MTFTNPFRRLLGIDVERSDGGEATIVIADTAPDLLQSRGIMHGGVAATLVDVGCGEALRSVLEPGEVISTIDLNVSYVRPGRAGRIEARGRVLRRGRRVAFCVTDVLDADGELVATGRATISIRPPQ